MNRIAVIIFLIVLAVWLYLEFSGRENVTGLKDILFWIGMCAMFAEASVSKGRHRAGAT